MIIYPALDILSSSAVRLYRGDYGEVTRYSSAPLDVALELERKGAKHLHIVDLDGARKGEKTSSGVIGEIASKTSLRIELGGGIRSEEDIEYYLSMGIDRVILGTRALDFEFLELMIRKFGSERIVAGVDLRDGCVSLSGWMENTALDGIAALSRMEALGLRYAVVTDISKDGTLSGPSVELYTRIMERTGLRITASGGIGTIEDVRSVKSTGCWGCIIGKAYYEGKVMIEDALREEL